jgi:tetratricopeptide (TPR) repeat protein
VVRPPGRRRLARILLATLIGVHLVAFAGYSLLQRQARHLQLFLDAREQWRAGHLDVAAAEYRTFVTDYAAASSPLVLHHGFPSQASGWFALGRVEAERGHASEALAAWSESMRLEAGLGRREYRDLLLETGRGAALVAFAEAERAREPASAVAARDLGAARLAIGEPAAAAQAYERALELLPALLARRDPAWHGSLSDQEADLTNLLAVARLEAGDRPGAEVACDSLNAREPAGVHLERLCRAFLLADRGNRDASLEQLKGYLPPAPEHEALVAQLRARLGVPPEPRPAPSAGD